MMNEIYKINEMDGISEIDRIMDGTDKIDRIMDGIDKIDRIIDEIDERPLDLTTKNNSRQREKLKDFYKELLVHVGKCRKITCFRECGMMKKSVQHIFECKTKKTCAKACQVAALCCTHAVDCQEADCTTPYCLFIRRMPTFKKHQLKWKM